MCNKAFSYFLIDIRSYKRFDQCVTDLASEICVLLEEEETRYGRRAEIVKVEYKFKIGNMESQQFDLEPSTLSNMHHRVLTYFASLPESVMNPIHFTHLAFVLLQFVSM